MPHGCAGAAPHHVVWVFARNGRALRSVAVVVIGVTSALHAASTAGHDHRTPSLFPNVAGCGCYRCSWERPLKTNHGSFIAAVCPPKEMRRDERAIPRPTISQSVIFISRA